METRIIPSKTVYISADGREFDDLTDCARHENKVAIMEFLHGDQEVVEKFFRIVDSAERKYQVPFWRDVRELIAEALVDKVALFCQDCGDMEAAASLCLLPSEPGAPGFGISGSGKLAMLCNGCLSKRKP